jgi:hypothetical protein
MGRRQALDGAGKLSRGPQDGIEAELKLLTIAAPESVAPDQTALRDLCVSLDEGQRGIDAELDVPARVRRDLELGGHRNLLPAL